MRIALGVLLLSHFSPGGIFRIADCKYMYNLATSSLMGAGKYNVYATIDDMTFPVATFELK